MSTGEASGDMLAASLAEAMRRREPSIAFSGIGSERMEAAGFRLSSRTHGWASLGPVEALRRIPSLLAVYLAHVIALRLSPVDLIVLVDFGAFNLRLAMMLRRLRYRGPILYYFPPGAWLDRRSKARAVAHYTTALTPFVHQRDFYRSLGLPIVYFGHPLAGLVSPREPRPTAPADGGTIALLPGSRLGELKFHTHRLLRACELLRERRPRLAVVIAAADADCERMLRASLSEHRLAATIVRGAREAFDLADIALVASGTAVLEAALREVPTVALYFVEPALEKMARRIWPHRHTTLPNILLGREVVPELLQDEATPAALAAEAEKLLRDPGAAVAALRDVRAALGPADALERAADYALELARAGWRRAA